MTEITKTVKTTKTTQTATNKELSAGLADMTETTDMGLGWSATSGKRMSGTSRYIPRLFLKYTLERPQNPP